MEFNFSVLAQPPQPSQLATPTPPSKDSTDRGEADTAHGNSNSCSGKMFVGGLSWQTTAVRLQQYFGVFGRVSDVMLMRDPLTQRSRGFGFVTFADPMCVEHVLQLSTHILDGKRIDPKIATPHQAKLTLQSAASSVASLTPIGTSTKLFVGGISQHTTANDLDVYFSQFGQVTDVVLPMDQSSGRHRGFGFVTFGSADVVDQMCRAHYHWIKQKRVECKRARPIGSGAPAAVDTSTDYLVQTHRRMMDEFGVLQTMANCATGAIDGGQRRHEQLQQSMTLNGGGFMQTILSPLHNGYR